MAKKNKGNKAAKQVVNTTVETPAPVEQKVPETKVELAAEPETKAPETTPETPKTPEKPKKKEDNKPAPAPEKPKKKEKVETPIVEEVVVEEIQEVHEEQKPKPNADKKPAIVPNVGSLSPDGRVQLLGLVKSEYLTPEVKETSPELFLSMKGYFDFGIAYTIVEDMQFLQEEGLKKGLAIDVSKLAEFMQGFSILGVTIDKKKLPAPVDGQQVIPFEAVTVSKETKKDLQEVREIKEEVKDVVILNPKELMSLPESEREDSIRKTLLHFLTKNSPYKSIHTAIGWFQSFNDKLDKGSALIEIYKIVGPIGPLKIPSNSAYHTVVNNKSPFGTHCTLSRYFERYTDKDLASMLNGFLAIAKELQPKAIEVDSFLKWDAKSIEELMNKRARKGDIYISDASVAIVSNINKKDLGDTTDAEYSTRLANRLVDIANAYYDDETIHHFDKFEYKK